VAGAAEIWRQNFRKLTNARRRTQVQHDDRQLLQCGVRFGPTTSARCSTSAPGIVRANAIEQSSRMMYLCNTGHAAGSAGII
jgi:hypothetical protein